MKIRQGFISNSSSSSFVIALPKKPKNVEELKKMLFGKQEWFYNSLASEEEETDISTQYLAERVFKKIKKKATIKEMEESIQDGYFDSFGFLPGYYDGSENTDWKKWDINDIEYSKNLNKYFEGINNINKKRARDILDTFITCNEEKYFIVVSFSDNEGEAIEEHSEIFERVEHIKTSYH